jgi:simple sugar transport system ATP-binding protein
MENSELIRLENVSKSFGSVRALKNVSLAIRTGEVVALLGDNGAGKSTLIKAISGVILPDSGRIYFKGNPVTIRNTRDAIDLGIETIHQDSSLAPDLSIANNLFLGREPVKSRRLGVFALLDHRHMTEQANALLKRVGISKKLDPQTPVRALSGGERQSIAIARAMFFLSNLIILDEPTNNLGVEETRNVVRFVRGAREAGHSCIYITHSLHHVFQVAGRVVVMRRGEIVADTDSADTNLEQIERIITGE